MKKNWKRALSLLFVLVLMLQAAGLSAGADYDPNVTGSEPLSIAVYIPVTDEFGTESIARLDGETVTLPEGKSLGLRLGDTELGIYSALTLGDLTRSELLITPPEGYYVEQAYLCASELGYGQTPAALKGAAEYPSGTRITLKPDRFVDTESGSFDSARLSNTGGSYTLLISLALLEKVETVTVSYSSGDVYAAVPGSEWGSAGSSFTAANMEASVEGKTFTGWQLTYGNGSVVDVAPGYSFQPYADCTLVAQWADAEPAPSVHEHNWVTTDETPAGCTTDGVRYLKCECGETTTQTIPATGHSYVDTVVEPTYEAGGYTQHVCSNCGDSYVDNYTDKLEPAHTHSYSESVTTEPGCTTDGVKTFTCSCGDTYTEPIPATGHSYVDTVVEPTYEAGGYTQHVCSKCGDSYVDNYTDKLVHTHSYTESVTREASCTVAGEKTFTCSCGDTYTEPIAATGHSYSEAVTTQPGCETAGVKTFTCTKCNESYTETIPAKGHDFEVTVVMPTLNAQGYTLHKCKTCGYEFRDAFTELTQLPAPRIDSTTWTKGSGTGYTLTVDYDYAKFSSLLLNGTLLTRDVDYSVRSGSTVIELKNTTLEKLLTGTAKLDIVFTDAKAALEFTVQPEASRTVKTDLSIRPKNRTAVYSGETITANEYEIVGGSLNAGDSIVEIAYGGGSENVTTGATTSITKLVIKDGSGTDVTSTNYNVSISTGTVVVTARPLTITGQNIQKTYDGNAFSLQNEYASLISSDKLPAHSVSVSLGIYQNGSVVNEARAAGTYEIKLTNYSVQNGSIDVTANYALSGALPLTLGTLSITGQPAQMIPVTVTARSQTWTYDGQAHDLHEYTLSSQMQDGDTISVSFDATSTITNVGTVANKVGTVTIKDKNGAAVPFALNGQGAGKYNVTVTPGTLKVDPFKLTLTAVSAEKYYDGTALKNDNVKATALISGHKFSVVKFAVTDSQGNLIKNGPVSVGTYTKKVTDVTILDANNNDVTQNYDITKVDGTLKILQANGNNNSKSPKTGDENNLGLWIGLLAGSAVIVLGIVGFLYFRNKKTKAARKPAARKPRGRE